MNIFVGFCQVYSLELFRAIFARILDWAPTPAKMLSQPVLSTNIETAVGAEKHKIPAKPILIIVR